MSDYDYISNFISVPQLDNLRHDMVNTGRVLDETGSEVSFASSEGGALNMSETPQNSCSIKGRQPAKKPEKRFSKWGRKKKPDPPGYVYRLVKTQEACGLAALLQAAIIPVRQIAAMISILSVELVKS